MKLSQLESRIEALCIIKTQITSLYEIPGHTDWDSQQKKEQTTIMDIITMLREMQHIDSRHFNSYLKHQKWAQDLLDAYDNENFKHMGPWNAFH